MPKYYVWIERITLVLAVLLLITEWYKLDTNNNWVSRIDIYNVDNLDLLCAHEDCIYIKIGDRYYVPGPDNTVGVITNNISSIESDGVRSLYVNSLYVSDSEILIYKSSILGVSSDVIILIFFILITLLIAMNILGTIRISEDNNRSLRDIKESSALESNLKMLISATAHHEMLTPIAVLKSSVKTLKKYCDTDNKSCPENKLNDSFNIMESTVCRLESVLNQMSSDRRVYKKPESRYYKIITTTLKSLQVLFTEFNFEYVVNDKDLLNSVSSRKLATGTVGNILNNMFKNSLEAGANEITIHAELKNASMLDIYIIDNGNGIDVPNNSDNDIIFKLKYSRKNKNIDILNVNRKLNEDGVSSGDGLFLVRSILRNTGGDVVLIRTDTNGTTFKLTVPINKV